MERETGIGEFRMSF